MKMRTVNTLEAPQPFPFPSLRLEKPLRRLQVGREIICINQVSMSLGSNPKMRRQKFWPTHLKVGSFSPHEKVSVWTERSWLPGLQPHPRSETAEAPFPIGTDFSSPHSAACAFVPQRAEKAKPKLELTTDDKNNELPGRIWACP